MKFKGTKGKWKVLHDRVATLEGEITICKIEQYNEEDEADALLISKAPEMLEMLENINEYLLADGSLKAHSYQGEVEKLIKEATEL